MGDDGHPVIAEADIKGGAGGIGTVDRAVDALRQRGVSIARMNPRRASLEEVFLESIDVPRQAND